MSQVYCLRGLCELQTQKLTFALLCIMLFFLWQVLFDREKTASEHYSPLAHIPKSLSMSLALEHSLAPLSCSET